MKHSIDHHELESALKDCGSHWSAAQAHGLLCSRLAVAGTDGALAWRNQVLAERISEGDSERCTSLLDSLFQTSWQQLTERLSDFELLLPDDDEDAGERTQALAEWSEGFLHGLVADKKDEDLRSVLGRPPLSDLIKDLLEITRASVGEAETQEDNERAYAEIVEYVRVAAQLAFEELADLREPHSAVRSDSPGTLH